ncbi:hypothetical protein BDZ89DRAFT_1043456 [Hymenopellis radicata]|nr:hypothetical protein BDZ89DRAFT_1043456 [Hymenopellis radicata]
MTTPATATNVITGGLHDSHCERNRQGTRTWSACLNVGLQECVRTVSSYLPTLAAPVQIAPQFDVKHSANTCEFTFSLRPLIKDVKSKEKSDDCHGGIVLWVRVMPYMRAFCLEDDQHGMSSPRFLPTNLENNAHALAVEVCLEADTVESPSVNANCVPALGFTMPSRVPSSMIGDVLPVRNTALKLSGSASDGQDLNTIRREFMDIRQTFQGRYRLRFWTLAAEVWSLKGQLKSLRIQVALSEMAYGYQICTFLRDCSTSTARC